MRILFDHQIFQLQKFGGISRYFSEIINQLSGEHKIDIAIKYSDNRYLSKNNFHDINPIVEKRQEFLKGIEFYGKGRLFNLCSSINPKKYKSCYRENLEYSIELLRNQDFDVFHPTYYDDYFLDLLKNKPFVLTIHDMTYELFPEFFPVNDRTRFIKKKLAHKANHIIAVSENTKKDIIEFYGINDDKISVVHHGASISNETKILNNKEFDFKYFLFVGIREGYKNFLFLIHSICDIMIHQNINLVCTGQAFNDKEIKLFEDLNISGRVLHKYVDNFELSSLYKNAIALIFPSLYEGFGFPIVEAFANDCPVLLSNTDCFREIAGDAALYFNPKCIDEIRSGIFNILKSDYLRKELIAKGKATLGKFSWENSATETLQVYKKVI